MDNQNLIFKEGEADCWYERNKSGYAHSETSKPAMSFDIEELCLKLEPFKKEINNVLEIGCSNGKKLEAICSLLEASGKGIDPSDLAVSDGNQRMQALGIQLFSGTSDNLPFNSDSFDLVYFGFCTYLFDRKRLLTALAEADRVLKNGGFLAITDFDPGMKYKRPYIHKAGVYSYKQDYSKFYTESGLY